MAWAWNEAARRYYNPATGRFLTRTQALGFVEQSLAATASATDLLANYVANDLLAVADWRLLMREEIKGEYIRQACLGRGGRAQMTQSDWGLVGSQIKEQYRYLDGFAREVAEGRLSEAQIRSRAQMYTNSAREAFESMQQRVAEASGYDEEAWTVNAALENCPDCLDFQALGWQPVGTFPTPGDGSTVCLTNCGCAKEFRKSETGDLFWGEEEGEEERSRRLCAQLKIRQAMIQALLEEGEE